MMPDHQQSQGSGQRLLPSVGEGRGGVLPLTLVVPVLLLPALVAEGEGGGPHLQCRRNKRPPLLHGVLNTPQPLPPAPAPRLGCQPPGTAYDAGGARAQQQCRGLLEPGIGRRQAVS